MPVERRTYRRGDRLVGGIYPGEFVPSTREQLRKSIKAGDFLTSDCVVPTTLAPAPPRFGDLPDPAWIQKRIDALAEKIEAAAALVRKARASP